MKWLNNISESGYNIIKILKIYIYYKNNNKPKIYNKIKDIKL